MKVTISKEKKRREVPQNEPLKTLDVEWVMSSDIQCVTILNTKVPFYMSLDQLKLA